MRYLLEEEKLRKWIYEAKSIYYIGDDHIEEIKNEILRNLTDSEMEEYVSLDRFDANEYLLRKMAKKFF